MSNLKKILTSFKTRQSLNPKVWIKKDNEVKMNPKVREKLLEVANDFIEYLKVEIVITDVIITGSLANYNWSSFSDFDLHVVADFSQFPEKQLDLYKELFSIKKTLYNEKHDITIYGYDVELYLQNETEAHFSSGIYSILFNEWSNKPKKEKIKIDKDLIKTKSEQWMSIIDNIIKNMSDEPLDTAKKIIKKYKEKLKKYRTCGLEKQGEYSDENLVFKVLRRNGYIEKLMNFENKLIDKNYSLKEGNTNIGGPFKTDIENGPANHGKRAFGNWQSDNAWDIFAPPGSVVNSYTEGTVGRVRETNKRSGKVFGTQITVNGSGNFPDIFYTHLKNVRLKRGDVVKLGDYIGEVTEWCTDETCNKLISGSHVHIGLPKGRHIRELLVNSDKIFTGTDSQSTDSGNQENYTGTTPTGDISDVKVFGQRLLDLYNSGKTFKNLKKEGQTLTFDLYVETIQTCLQILGFSLPVWGIDGKFGNETEEAVKKFQKENGLNETGLIESDEIKKLITTSVELVSKDPSILKNLQKTKTDNITTSTEVVNGDIKIVGNFNNEQIKNINYLIDEMKKIGITNPYTQIGILSVIAKESGFVPKGEVSYATTSNDRIRKIFGSRVAKYSDSELDNLKKDEKKFFNVVYASTVGNQGGDDGWIYRGRGFNQLTGIKNYEKYGNMIGMGDKLVKNPDLVNDVEIASKIAISFFTKGKSPSSFPNFIDKEEAAKYFADINAGGVTSSHRENAIAKTKNFDVVNNLA